EMVAQREARLVDAVMFVDASFELQAQAEVGAERELVAQGECPAILAAGEVIEVGAGERDAGRALQPQSSRQARGEVERAVERVVDLQPSGAECEQQQRWQRRPAAAEAAVGL